MPILQQIGGWKPWFYAKTIRYDPGLKLEFKTASAPFPPSYLPARAFWAETFAVHCLLPTPWTFTSDPYSAFLTGGGATGSLVGAIGGLGLAAIVMNDPQAGSWGLGRRQIGLPQVGFCIGDKYKEHAYFYISVLKLVFYEILATSCIDVFQRSRLKRIYVIEGMVTRCIPDPTAISSGSSPTTQYILTLDLEGVAPTGLPSINGDTLSVYKKDGSTVTLEMKALLPNWEIVVAITSDPSIVPAPGDFYKLNTPWCIEDPYMMSGFMHDSEGFGPYTLEWTSHNYPFSDVTFVGFYVYRAKAGAASSAGPMPATIVAAAPGSAFTETETHEWIWKYYTGIRSQIYNENKYRYYNVEAGSEDDPSFSGDYISPTMKKFNTANDGDLATWKSLDGVNYARMEINIGGNSARQNWHSPILTKCWFKQGGKYFAILGQPDGNVIDIALRDVTNTADLVTDSGSGGEILNQYAWMINEHYTECGYVNGFLQGMIDSATYDSLSNQTEIKWKSEHMSYGTLHGYGKWPVTNPNPDSFYNRFTSSSSGSLKKMWKKYQYWRVYNETRKTTFEVDPTTVSISGPPADIITPSDVVNCSVKVYGDMSGSSLAGFYFDKPYERVGALLLPIYIYDIKQAIEPGNPLSVLCVDFSYRSAVMAIQIPNDVRIGSTGAQWWGLGLRGMSSILSNDNLDLFVTVPLAPRGISSFYHYNRQQDWIFFQDINTNRLTLRRGNVDFTESPRREEVIVGLPESTGTASGFPITFDTTKERVKLITMELPTESLGTVGDEFGPSALTFQIDNPSDYFGFTSTGSGTFDFRALQANGYAPGTVDYSKYKAQGNFISPVYRYTKRDYDVTFHTYDTLELGIDTKVKLLVKNGNPSNINIEYVNNNQTLRYIGFFDVHHMTDGEVFTIYGRRVDTFTMDGTEYDPNDGTNKWPTTECIFAIGTADNSLTWGTPNAKFLTISGDEDYQYPVMFINACNYLTSCYNDVSERLIIIMKGYHKDTDGSFTPFIGCYTLNRMTMTMDTEICDANPDLNFWYRKSRVDSAILADDEKNPVDTDFNLSPFALPPDNVAVDSFVRVLGTSVTKSQIDEEVDDLGVVSVALLNPGTTIILYKDEEGVRMLSSNDIVKWGKSRIILARSGESAMLVGSNLFYITNEGIVMKSDMDENMCQAALAIEGAGYSDAEIESVQETFDNARTLLIGSGRIDAQRISGHISHDGTYKIMYYNDQNILCCLESKDTFKWKMANNF